MHLRSQALSGAKLPPSVDRTDTAAERLRIAIRTASDRLIRLPAPSCTRPAALGKFVAAVQSRLHLQPFISAFVAHDLSCANRLTARQPAQQTEDTQTPPMASAMYIMHDYVHTVTCACCLYRLNSDTSFLANTDFAEGLCWRACILLSTPCFCVCVVAGSPCLCYYLWSRICDECKESCAALTPRVIDEGRPDASSIEPPPSQAMN